MRSASLVFAVAVAIVACRSNGSVTPATVEAGAPTASAAPPSTAKTETPWACRANGDCSNSCAHGAVNRDWEAMHSGGDACEDGCASKGVDPPRCEDGECVAYAKGVRVDECTRKSLRDE